MSWIDILLISTRHNSTMNLSFDAQHKGATKLFLVGQMLPLDMSKAFATSVNMALWNVVEDNRSYMECLDALDISALRRGW